MNQPPPSVPQNYMDYVGVYAASIGGVQVHIIAQQRKLIKIGSRIETSQCFCRTRLDSYSVVKNLPPSHTMTLYIII
jgi:hypothetical protein